MLPFQLDNKVIKVHKIVESLYLPSNCVVIHTMANSIKFIKIFKCDYFLYIHKSSNIYNTFSDLYPIPQIFYVH